MAKQSKALQNRELSWLQFNQRVLNEANRTRNPLFERLRFLSIVHSNLDEFFMIRVGGLINQKLLNPHLLDSKTKWNAEKQLREISISTHHLSKNIAQTFAALKKELETAKIYHLAIEDINHAKESVLEESFERDIRVLLSAQIIDSKHPFPQLLNKQVYVVVELEKKGKKAIGIVSLNPLMIPEILALPLNNAFKFIQTIDLVYLFANRLFKGWNIISKGLIRLIRNADLHLEESDDLDFSSFRTAMKNMLKKRALMGAVRLETRYDLSDSILITLRKVIGVDKDFIFKQDSPLSYDYLASIEIHLKAKNRNKLFYEKQDSNKRFNSMDKVSVMNTVAKEDILIATPFESFSTYLMFLNEAANDPNVYSISITLYRIASESRVLQSLIQAAENGKDVTVVFELTARFDESNNIEWSSLLEEAGVRVIYGTQGYKVHSKLTLIKRKINHKIQFLSHIGTGNYNEKTARLYTDFHLLSANAEIGIDIDTLFQALLTNSAIEPNQYLKLLVAPHSLKQQLIELIGQEIEFHKKFGNGHIVIKINSLTDLELIEALITASQAGVKIQMIVRGITCLVPQVKGETENIEIRSVVGRLLEHSRYYYFNHNEIEKIFISSADWMTRNMDRRVEVAVLIENPLIKEKIKEIINFYFKDSENTWVLNENADYKLIETDEKTNIHQELFVALEKYTKQPNVSSNLKAPKNWLIKLFSKP